jgi:hypothetical protein
VPDVPRARAIRYTERVRRLSAVLAASFAAVTLTVALGGAPAAAQESPTTSQGTPVDQDIIPEPDSGQNPSEAGDRGGALQYAVLGLIVVGIGGGAYLAVRESRRKRAEQARQRVA